MSDFAKDANVPSNDCISRQAAIEAVSDCGICIQRIVDLPSVQPEQDAFTKWAKSVADRYRPERKKGKWIMAPDGWAYCSICESFPEGMMGLTNYCPNCGVDMRGE